MKIICPNCSIRLTIKPNQDNISFNDKVYQAFCDCQQFHASFVKEPKTKMRLYYLKFLPIQFVYFAIDTNYHILPKGLKYQDLVNLKNKFLKFKNFR